MLEQSKKADLHLHTNISDGRLSPIELFDKMREHGLSTIAVTDHDSVAAVDALNRRAQMFNLRIVTGVELSGEFEGLDIHFLGYFIQHHNKRFLDYLYLFQRRRHQRAQEMVAKLEKLGIHIALDDVVSIARNRPIGRPHIADALISGGHVSSQNEAFEKYLGGDGPVYVEKYKITASEIIELIHSIGGAAFVAHPGISCSDEIVRSLVEAGLDGLEVVHPKHSPDKQKELAKIATELSLLTSGGSDFHGEPEREADLGKYSIPDESVDAIEEYCKSMRDTWGYLSEEELEDDGKVDDESDEEE